MTLRAQTLGMAAVALGLLANTPAFAAPPTLDAVRASELGTWQGTLEYRDYQADRWFGLPVTTRVTDGGDGVTQLRTSDFDDGPKSALKAKIVRITTISMLGKDGRTLYASSFRKGDVPELSTSSLAVDPASADATHWTTIETEQGRDNDRPAEIRVTTHRDGDRLTSLKEVRFTDAGAAVDKPADKPGTAQAGWLVRNRTTLVRLPG